MARDPQPVIQDQHTAARAYFFCILGMLICESLIHIPSYITNLLYKGLLLSKSPTSHSKIRVLLHKLVTLPSPLPFITRHSFPTYIRFTVFTGFNILFGYNRVKYTTDYKLYGWLTLANGGLALLMGTRTNFFATILRIPSLTLLIYHRLIGRATLVHATLHFALTVHHGRRTRQLLSVLSNRQIQSGVVAWVALCIIAITSISLVRRRFFEAFYYSHTFFLVFVIAALVHAAKAPEFLLPGLCLWLVDRGVRFANNFRTISVRSVTRYRGDVTKIKVEGLGPAHPGQIAWVQIPDISFFNWHPFTIVSGSADGTATFAIRGLGGYTGKVQRLADEAATVIATRNSLNNIHQVPEKVMRLDVRMRVDCPYRTSSIHYEQYQVVVLVAGGIGITPGISIASHIIDHAAQQCSGRVSDGDRHVHLLWVVKDTRHVAWFGDELARLDNVALGSAGKVTLDITIFVTGKDRAPDQSSRGEEYAMETPYAYSGPYSLLKGRPNLGQWFKSVKSQRRGLDGAVNLCGPWPLMDDARRAAASVSGTDGLFHVEEEVFEL